MKFCKKLDATEYLSDWSEEKIFSEKKIPTFSVGLFLLPSKKFSERKKRNFFFQVFFTKANRLVKIALDRTQFTRRRLAYLIEADYKPPLRIVSRQFTKGVFFMRALQENLVPAKYFSNWHEEKNFAEKKIPTFFGGKIFYVEKKFIYKIKIRC